MTFEDFDHLIQDYVDRSEPAAIAFDVFQELAAESNQPLVEIALTGVVKEGVLQLSLAEPTDVPLQVQNNEILINNLRLVIQLHP
jgi:hypothetical protein